MVPSITSAIILGTLAYLLREVDKLLKQFFKYIKEPEINDRLFFARVIVCLGFISGIVISYPLWINDRFYPLAPVGDFVPLLSPPFDTILFAGILMLLAILVFYPQKYIFAGFFSLMAFALLQDQSRWQPWVYQYSFIIGAIAWFQTHPLKKHGRHAIACIQIILIGTYLWSGIQKLNYNYLFETFEWLLSPALEAFPILQSMPLSLFALISILIEAGGGIALAFRRTERLGAWVLIGMHCFIFIMIGPAGKEYNRVVWPWNICFVMLIGSIFLGKKNSQETSRLFPQNFYHGLVIIIFLILPVLNIAGVWDHYLSSSLYSGNLPYGKIHVTDTVKKKFPKRIKTKFNLLNGFSIRKWSFTELHASDYPQPRIYKTVFRKLCKYQQHKYGLVLEIYGTADLITGKRKRQEYFCHELIPS